MIRFKQTIARNDEERIMVFASSQDEMRALLMHINEKFPLNGTYTTTELRQDVYG